MVRACGGLQIHCIASDGGGWVFSGSADCSVRAWRLRSDASWACAQVRLPTLALPLP